MSLHGDDRILIVFAYFFLLAIPVILVGIERKLERIIRLLEIANQERGEANASLRSIDHNSEVIRERTPRP